MRNIGNYQLYQNGYYIWCFRGGLVMREDMEFCDNQEEPFRFQVARWIKGKGYEVLHYTGCQRDALEIYELTVKLGTLSQVA